MRFLSQKSTTLALLHVDILTHQWFKLLVVCNQCLKPPQFGTTCTWTWQAPVLYWFPSFAQLIILLVDSSIITRSHQPLLLWYLVFHMQGLILGPHLFLIFIDDYINQVPSCHLYWWYFILLPYVSFNTYKCKAMHIHTKHTNKLLPSPLTLDGAKLHLGHWVTVSTKYGLDDKSRCLREFRSPRKPSYRQPERKARGRLFGFQGDLNSRGHRESSSNLFRL